MNINLRNPIIKYENEELRPAYISKQVFSKTCILLLEHKTISAIRIIFHNNNKSMSLKEAHTLALDLQFKLGIKR